MVITMAAEMHRPVYVAVDADLVVVVVVDIVVDLACP